MDTVTGFFTARKVQVATLRRPGANEYGVVIFFQDFLKTGDVVIKVGMNAQGEDVAYFFVEDAFRESEPRYLSAHHATALMPLVVKVYFIAERCQVPRNCQRGRATPNETYFTAILPDWREGHTCFNVALVVSRDTLKSAYSNRFFVDTSATTCRFAGAVTGSAKHTGEHVRFPVDHVGVVVSAGGNEAYIFRHRCVRGACILAVDHLVEILRVGDVSGVHSSGWF
jgi:hypothetical protein